MKRVVSGLKEGDEVIIPQGLEFRDQDRVKRRWSSSLMGLARSIRWEEGQ